VAAMAYLAIATELLAASGTSTTGLKPFAWTWETGKGSLAGSRVPPTIGLANDGDASAARHSHAVRALERRPAE